MNNRPGILTSVVLVLFVFGIYVPPGFGSPFFDLDEPAEFQTALDDGRIVSVASWGPDLEFLYPGLEEEFRALLLSVDDQGLDLDFGEPPSDSYFISAFSYVYPEDPDLSAAGTRIKKRLEFDPPLRRDGSLSIHLMDETGKTKLWKIPVRAGTGISEIDVRANQPLGGIVKKVDPRFDLSKVIKIDYDMRLSDGQTKKTVKSISVIPEPATLALPTLGGLTFLYRRRA
jgi:hypothetical protein